MPGHPRAYGAIARVADRTRCVSQRCTQLSSAPRRSERGIVCIPLRQLLPDSALRVEIWCSSRLLSRGIGALPRTWSDVAGGQPRRLQDDSSYYARTSGLVLWIRLRRGYFENRFQYSLISMFWRRFCQLPFERRFAVRRAAIASSREDRMNPTASLCNRTES